MIQEDNIAPLKWKMGRVVNTFSDSEGKIRVVEVKIAISGTSKAVNKETGKVDLEKVKTRIAIQKRAIHRICHRQCGKSSRRKSS